MRSCRIALCTSLALVTVATGVGASPATVGPLERMTLREKVGQIVMFSVGGTFLSADERDVIRRQHLGSVILFSRNYRNRAQLEALTAQIQSAARRGNTLSIGALVSADQEGGVVKRFPDMPPWYSAPEIGRRGSRWFSWDQGRATGRAMRSTGVNVNLAPVADLDLPPSHVMRSRSFGSRRYRVGRLARAFGRGLQRRRVAATAKHFPGFGGATMNSDYGRAYIYRSKWKLHHIDAIPFRLMADAGVRLIMLSHGMYLNDGGRRPASVNRYIATRRLRRELGFKGVAISDALGAVAWRFGGSVPRACEATIRAGADIALITGGVYLARACARRIRWAVRNGRISKARLDRAVLRVLDLKRWLGVWGPATI